MSDNPYASTPDSNLPPAGFGGPSRQSILAKVTPPAIGLIVAGAINLVMSLWGIASSVLFLVGVGPAIAAQEQQMEQMEQLREDGIDLTRVFEVINMFQGPFGILLGLIQLAAAGFIIFGAIKMKSLQSYGLSLGAAVVAMIPMLSNCCCVSLPIGIWALVVLLDPHVKQSFTP
jgi:hypothetical protein